MSSHGQRLALEIGAKQSVASPEIAAVNLQVRTGLSVPFASYMAAREEAPAPSAEPVPFQVRTGLSVPFNPYMLGAHAEELLKRRVMISPVVVAWRYRVSSPADFTGWLATREILLSESRMAGDAEVKGVRYGGTYSLASNDGSAGAEFKTLWGYTSEAAMRSMHRLCSDDSVTATLVQLELIDFVNGLKRFIAEAGEAHFSEEVMISAAAGQA